METFTVDSRAREELVDITGQVRRIVQASGTMSGLCHIWCHHTTAAITVNENADPDVPRDLVMALDRIVHDDWPFRHAEGNSPAHLKSSMLGCSAMIPIQDGRLVLGTWQGIFFAEFDGPRKNRKVSVTVINSGG